MDIIGVSHIKGRVVDLNVKGRRLLRADVSDFVRLALFNRNLVAVFD